MANEDPKPRAITHKEIVKAGGKTGSMDTWRKIGEITGAGYVPLNEDGDAAIDITGLAPGKVEQIDKLLAEISQTKEGEKTEEVKDQPKKASK